MANFLAELKRRNIYRVGAAYAVVAWVLLQLAANISPILDLPPWIARTVVLLLIIGFPIAIIFAWVQQLPPDGGSVARPSTGKLDWILISALVLVIALMSYQQLAPSGAKTVQQQKPAPLAPVNAGIAIAVLPFTNLSGDASQEFFSDGMTEEITAALAKVPDLHVVARTSAFQFKGQNSDIQMIGQQLHATHLIEGSVRKAGDRVRITAQLIQADNGLHVWTDSYDRQLTDIFAIQEDIARTITTSLRVPLGLKPGENLVNNRSINPESYQQFLQAKALVRARGLKSLTDAAALLERVVARDSSYAPAWALLAQAYAQTPTAHPAYNTGVADELRRVADASLPKAEAAARRAIQLDPGLADGYASLGRTQDVRGKLLLAEEPYSKALEIDPNNPDALHSYSLLLAAVGRLKEALAMRQRLQALEPFVPVFNDSTSRTLWLNGRTDDAIAMSSASTTGPATVNLAKFYASVGRYKEAADAVAKLPSPNYPPEMVTTAVSLLRAAPTVASSPQTLPRLGVLEFAYLYVGASNRALEFYESHVDAGYSIPAYTAFLWHPSYAAVRKTERFKNFARNVGLVEYWRAKGWPDLCRPMGADGFVCE